MHDNCVKVGAEGDDRYDDIQLLRRTICLTKPFCLFSSLENGPNNRLQFNELINLLTVELLFSNNTKMTKSEKVFYFLCVFSSSCL